MALSGAPTTAPAHGDPDVLGAFAAVWDRAVLLRRPPTLGSLGTATPGCAVRLLEETTGRVWFSTDDLGRVDHDGQYRFHGRGSDIVKVGGENVRLVEAWAADRLSQAKRPRRLAFVRQLSGTSVGKPRRSALNKAADSPTTASPTTDTRSPAARPGQPAQAAAAP